MGCEGGRRREASRGTELAEASLLARGASVCCGARADCPGGVARCATVCRAGEAWMASEGTAPSAVRELCVLAFCSCCSLPWTLQGFCCDSKAESTHRGHLTCRAADRTTVRSDTMTDSEDATGLEGPGGRAWLTLEGDSINGVRRRTDTREAGRRPTPGPHPLGTRRDRYPQDGPLRVLRTPTLPPI